MNNMTAPYFITYSPSEVSDTTELVAPESELNFMQECCNYVHTAVIENTSPHSAPTRICSLVRQGQLIVLILLSDSPLD